MEENSREVCDDGVSSGRPFRGSYWAVLVMLYVSWTLWDGWAQSRGEGPGRAALLRQGETDICSVPGGWVAVVTN